MIELSTLILFAALAAVPLAWLVPGERGIGAVAALAALVLGVAAPISAALIIMMAAVLPLVMQWGEQAGRRGLISALGCLACLAVFAYAQLSSGPARIGIAFFTLRQLHVIAEWWMGRIKAPGLIEHLRYQLFLPALVIGPVHRLPTFEREIARRRWDWSQFLSGAERVLIGAFSAEVIGNVLIHGLKIWADDAMQDSTIFLRSWVLSAIEWIALFFTFAGMSAIAIGLALMMGVRLEENFNRPWAARDLLDFWSRWHMSLTGWCRDYVFRPVMALTRSPIAGLVAAMLAIGLWHEFSIYYVLWSFWQTAGVVLSRTVLPLLARPVPLTVRRVMAPVLILGWLSLARPVIDVLKEVIR